MAWSFLDVKKKWYWYKLYWTNYSHNDMPSSAGLATGSSQDHVFWKHILKIKTWVKKDQLWNALACADGFFVAYRDEMVTLGNRHN